MSQLVNMATIQNHPGDDNHPKPSWWHQVSPLERQKTKTKINLLSKSTHTRLWCLSTKACSSWVLWLTTN